MNVVRALGLAVLLGVFAACAMAEQNFLDVRSPDGGPDASGTDSVAPMDSRGLDVPVGADSRGDATLLDAPGDTAADAAIEVVVDAPSADAPDVACGAGQMRCTGVCTDTMTSVVHCGRCGSPCPVLESCVAGMCLAPCAAGSTRCAGTCVDTRSSVTNCGACGVACPAGQSCSAGVCGVMMATWSTRGTDHDCAMPGVIGMRFEYLCPPGGSPSSLWGTGTYTSDSSICTAAVHAGRITLAAGGTISVEMRAGQPSYTGSVRNGVTSNSYGTWACSFGVVAPACMLPTMECASVCTSVATDSANCGACGNACGAGLVCTGGVCGCPPGQMRCGTSCVDTMTSATNCGACGVACAPTQACVAGMCTCAVGQTVCSGTCVDTPTNASHCGACGMACTAGLLCRAGVCGAMAATWSTSATAYNCATPGVIGTRVTFGCPPAGTASAIWGTDVYTHDSSICTAAVHVGRITLATGGAVTIQMMAGQASYTASTRNGITSNPYGAWGCSFGIP